MQINIKYTVHVHVVLPLASPFSFHPLVDFEFHHWTLLKRNPPHCLIKTPQHFTTIYSSSMWFTRREIDLMVSKRQTYIGEFFKILLYKLLGMFGYFIPNLLAWQSKETVNSLQTTLDPFLHEHQQQKSESSSLFHKTILGTSESQAGIHVGKGQ